MCDTLLFFEGLKMERQFMRKLELEALEERIVPTFFSWQSNGPANFSDPSAWWNGDTLTTSTVVPGVGDEIEIVGAFGYYEGLCTIDINPTVAKMTIGGSANVKFDSNKYITLDSDETSSISGGTITGWNDNSGFIVNDDEHTLNIIGGSFGSHENNIHRPIRIVSLKGTTNLDGLPSQFYCYVQVGSTAGNTATFNIANSVTLNIDHYSQFRVWNTGKLEFENTAPITSTVGGFSVEAVDAGAVIESKVTSVINTSINCTIEISKGELKIPYGKVLSVTGKFASDNYSVIADSADSFITLGSDTTLRTSYGLLVFDEATLRLFGSATIECGNTLLGHLVTISSDAVIDMDYNSTKSSSDVLTIKGSLSLSSADVFMNYNVESTNSSDKIVAQTLTGGAPNYGGVIYIGRLGFEGPSTLFSFDELGTTPVANQNHLIIDSSRGIRGSFNIQATQGMIINFPARHASTDEIRMRPINEIPAGFIEGQIWFDDDEDGEFDVNEDFIDSNVTVKLHDATDDSVIETVTATVGTYHFDNIASGSYYVTFDYSNGYQPMNFTTANATGVAEELDSEVTTDLSSGDIYRAFGKTANITVGTTDYIYGVNAGIYAVPMNSSIEGTVWHDEDEDGIQDDIGVYSGIQVELRDYLGNLIATTYTDTYGNYDFNNIAANDYYVRVNYSGLALTLANQTTDNLDSDFTDVDGTWATTGVFTLDIDETLDYDCGLFEILDEEEGPPPGP